MSPDLIKKQEQDIRLEIIRTLLSREIPPEKVVELATPLSEFVLKGVHPLPSGTACKDSAIT